MIKVRKTSQYYKCTPSFKALVSADYPDSNIRLFSSFYTRPTQGIVIKNKVEDRDLIHALCNKVDGDFFNPSSTELKNCYVLNNLIDDTINYNKLQLGEYESRSSYTISPTDQITNGMYMNSDKEIFHGGASNQLTYYLTNTYVAANAYDIHIAEPLAVFDSSNYYDCKGVFRIAWKFARDKRIPEQFTQKSAELYYKKISDNVYSKIIVNSNSYIFNNLENIDYNFYIKVVADDNQVSTTTIMTTTNEDAIGSVTALSPSNTIETGNVLFKWQYKNAYDSLQLAFDIAISEDSNEWKIIANHIESTETQCVLDVYNKNVYWKVRSYNLNDKPSEWSNILYFVNNAKQQPPINIRAEHTGRPLIEWECDGQIAYELETEGYKSGVIYSENRYHFLNEYLKNGMHLIKIRCYNSYGNKSEWSEFEYKQTMTIEKQPNVMVEKLLFGIKITIQSDPLFTKYYVYRNGVCIGKINDEIVDYFVQGECNYTIRGITVNDLFADSEVSVNYDFRGAQLITLDKVVIDVDKRLDSKPTRKLSVNIDCESKAYLGKKKLVHSFGTLVQRTINVACQSDYVPLGIICFYRDEYQSAFVICNSNSIEYFNYGNEAQFTLEETDFNEGIEYDI